MTGISSQFNKPSRYEQSCILSKIFYIYVFPILWKGLRQGYLKTEDLDHCPNDDKTSTIADKLEINWQKQIQNKKTPRFWFAILQTYSRDFVPALILYAISEWLVKTVQVVVLFVAVLRYLSRDPAWIDTDPLIISVYVFFFLLSVGVDNLLHEHAVYFSRRAGMRIRIACCAMIFQKSLKLSRAAIGKTAIGSIVNIMSNDVNRFDQIGSMVLYLIIGPVQAVISAYILWTYYGWSCFIGLGIMVGFIPFQLLACKLLSNTRLKIALLTDSRLRTMNEIITGMRVIKMYTWDKPFAAKVAETRRAEVSKIRINSYLRALNLLIYLISSRIVIFTLLISYVLFNKARLTTEQIFVTMFILNTLRVSLNWAFVTATTFLAELKITCYRIQKFLLSEEIQQHRSKSIDNMLENHHQLKNKHRKNKQSSINLVLDASRLDYQPIECQNPSVVVRNISAKWIPSLPGKTLNDISVELQPGDLLAVIGHVGSGKSSFLMTLLKELPLTRGHIEVNGKISYAGQDSWSYNDTIRANILFGLDYDKERYQKAIQVCAMNRDLTLMPFGDQTLVGEKGVTLSGGQKARICLARAVYRNADIYLLDDPLSAVDAAVAEHIFENCILDYLSNKIRILATHQIQFLQKANKILVLENGNCLAMGSYDELQRVGIDLSRTSSSSSIQQWTEIELQKENIMDLNENQKSLTELATRKTNEIATLKEIDEIDEHEIETKVAAEIGQKGSIKFDTFFQLYRTGGGLLISLVVILFTLVSQSLFHGLDFYITAWSNHPHEYTTIYEQQNYILVYVGLIVALLITSLIRAGSLLEMSLNVSRNLHNQIFVRLLRVPILFFDTTPVGRILNRFTKDMGVIDEEMPYNALEINIYFSQMVGTFVTLGVINPYLLIPSALMIVMVGFMRQFYIISARDIRRFEGIARSPVYSHVSTTINGLVSIRAFDAQHWFRNKYEVYQNDHTATWFSNLTTIRTFGMLVNFTLLFIVSSTTLMAFLVEGVTGSEAGLAIVSTMSFCVMIPWLMQQSAELENQLTSVERLVEYQKLDQEAEDPTEQKLPKQWPKLGQIEFDQMYLYYSNNNEKPVLKNINLLIRGGEKIGIVGRTGAGKSSIIEALFRLTEPKGAIKIDGIDIQSIGLSELRQIISIIPQNPVIYSGTVRYNLDPFGQYKDADIWAALDQVQLKTKIANFTERLESKLSENGGNLSVGQRQLICLARAILRQNLILVLDEATANIDNQTDNLIQETIRSKFANCTVLTIAHRLNTIVDCDRVMVLDAGHIVEFDSPYLLLERRAMFYEMCQKTGPEMYEQLFQIAKSTYNQQNQVNSPD